VSTKKETNNKKKEGTINQYLIKFTRGRLKSINFDITGKNQLARHPTIKGITIKKIINSA
jgi:hypothetical protein